MNGMPFRFCTGFKISFIYKYVREVVTGKKQRGEDGHPFRKIKNANLEPGKMPNIKIVNNRRSQRRLLK